MPQLFSPGATIAVKLVLSGLAALVVGVVIVLYMATWSTWATGQGMPPPQPVPFSHRHHVQGAGLDCRYCHTGVESSAVAGIPPARTCMTCHSQLFANSELLRPVRESAERGQPIVWNRVQRLADFVYFRHDVHVARGVSCETCHGDVGNMPLTYPSRAFHMSECLDCHRTAPGVDHERLTNCSTCHR
jgi:hypothetical protein